MKVARATGTKCVVTDFDVPGNRFTKPAELKSSHLAWKLGNPRTGAVTNRAGDSWVSRLSFHKSGNLWRSSNTLQMTYSDPNHIIEAIVSGAYDSMYVALNLFDLVRIFDIGSRAQKVRGQGW